MKTTKTKTNDMQEPTPATQVVKDMVMDSLGFWLNEAEISLKQHPGSLTIGARMQLAKDLIYLYTVWATSVDPTGQKMEAVQGANWLWMAGFLIDTVQSHWWNRGAKLMSLPQPLPVPPPKSTVVERFMDWCAELGKYD
jgi:hypothetical protein